MADGMTGNGVDAASGGHLFAPAGMEGLAAEILAAPRDGERFARDLRARHRFETEPCLCPADSSMSTMAGAGWAAVFPAAPPNTPEAREQDAIVEALAPLFELRRESAASESERRFRVLRGAQGYRPGDGADRFLARHMVGPGPADPERLGYFVLLVGSPAALPFDLQMHLGLHRAVGRIHFETVDEYAAYARGVVAAEAAGHARARELVAFAPTNPDDRWTRRAAERLVAPVTERLAQRHPEWEVRACIGEAARRDELLRTLTAAPAVLLAAGHGLGFAAEDPRRRTCQGAWIGQDWPGPRAGRVVDAGWCVAADDVGEAADLGGMIAVTLGSYAAGTPAAAGGPRGGECAGEAAFVSGLHRRLLAHPRGGALAAIGSLGPVWGGEAADSDGRVWRGWERQGALLEGMLSRLMEGEAIGRALEVAVKSHAAVAEELVVVLEEMEFGRRVAPEVLVDLWAGRADARGLVISGDPAVRVTIGAAGRRVAAGAAIHP